jgi:hypothetical protein
LEFNIKVMSVIGSEDISSLDFSTIEDLDPSLSDGSKLIYDREVPFEIKTVSNGALDHIETSGPIMESIKVKILSKGTDDMISSLRIEFSSESDLFFHYINTLSADTFDAFREHQHLMIDFLEFPNVIIKQFNSCIRDPKSHLAVLSLSIDGNSKLDFVQNMEYKLVELMSLSCKQSSDEMVQRQITFRYNSMKQKLALMQTRLHEINNMVKTKNPSLLLQMQRGGVSVQSNASLKLDESSRTKRSFYT